jgi:hypothetical protein
MVAVLVGVQGVDDDVHHSAHLGLKLKLLSLGSLGRLGFFGGGGAFTATGPAELPAQRARRPWAMGGCRNVGYLYENHVKIIEHLQDIPNLVQF